MVENLILPGIPKIYFLLGVKVASRKAYRIRDHLAILGRPLNVASTASEAVSLFAKWTDAQISQFSWDIEYH